MKIDEKWYGTTQSMCKASGQTLSHSNGLTGKWILTIIIHYLSSIALKKVCPETVWMFCVVPCHCLFIFVHLSVCCLEKRVCPEALHILCVVPYHFSSIFICLSDRYYEKGFVPKLCTCFVLSHTIFHLSPFTCQIVAMKQGLPWKCALVSCCPIRISILSNLLCV